MKRSKVYNTILVFNPAFLGDTVLTTPLLRLLRILYPKAQILFCVRPEHIGLFEGISIIDGVIAFDKRGKNKGLIGLIAFRKYIGSFKFDLVINLHRSLRSALICATLRNARVLGFKSAVFSRFFDDKVERLLNLQEVERNLMFASVLCNDFSLSEAKKLGGGLTCFIDSTLFLKIKHYYASTSLDKKIVGIAPGSVWNTKKYPAEYFAKIAEILYKAGYLIGLFGAPDDKVATDKFQEYYKYPFYDFASKTSLRELPAFLASVDVLVVNDSGAMHIAIAAGVPCVAIFGPTVKSLGFFPYDNRSIVIENNSLSCRPCSKHGGDVCPLGHFKCMKDIEPDRVAKSVLSILKKG